MLGHTMKKMAIGGSSVQAILVERATGDVVANADFRKEGSTAGI